MATPIAHYKYGYDSHGNIARSIDIVAAREYNYQYEDGKLIRATEAMVEFTNEMVTSKVIVNSIQYYYNAEDKMIKKVNTSANGSPQIIFYENVDDSTVVKFEIPAPTAENPEHKQMVTSHSKADSFGRKLFDELQLGTGFVSRQFHYHAGEVTDQHKSAKKSILI